MSNLIHKILKSPGRIPMNILYRAPYISKRIPDEAYLKFIYFCCFGKRLRLHNPQTYNAKLQWLKQYDRNPLYTKLVDKYEVRGYVASLIGEKYLIPLLGVWDTFNQINFAELPNQFVLKCTHDSGGVVICRDKNDLDIKKAKKKIRKSLNRNYYLLCREWPYKHVKPRILAEQFMVDESGKELKDYKFFCFSGIPKFLYIASERDYNTKFDFYDMEFNHLNVQQYHNNASITLKKPTGFDEMVNLAGILSKGFPHMRVDFYDVNGTIYFGEITFFHLGGFVPFKPEEFDIAMGRLLQLPSMM